MTEHYMHFYHLYPKGKRLKIEQAPVNRDWMDQTPNSYSYRCLPMTYASRHGWCVRLVEDVEVIWRGGAAAEQTEILTGRNQNGMRMADNGTGNGVVTFHLNAIPRTSKDWNIWIMGAPNLVIPGAAPLGGIVESDWMFTSPTMNWKITECDRTVVFKAGDPVIFFVPVHKTELELFKVQHFGVEDDPEIKRNVDEHSIWRAELAKNGGEVFGKAYLRGKRTDGTYPDWEHNHKTRLNLDVKDPNA